MIIKIIWWLSHRFECRGGCKSTTASSLRSPQCNTTSLYHILQLSNTFFKPLLHCFALADCNQLVTVINALVFGRLLFHRVGPRGRRGGILPYKRLMGMCRWMRSHFHDWIDYDGFAFLIELLEWGRTFSDFRGVRQFFIFTVRKGTRMFVLKMKRKVFFI